MGRRDGDDRPPIQQWSVAAPVDPEPRELHGHSLPGLDGDSGEVIRVIVR